MNLFPHGVLNTSVHYSTDLFSYIHSDQNTWYISIKLCETFQSHYVKYFDQTTWNTLWLQPRCACTSLGACQTSHNRRWYSTLGSTVYLALSSHSQPAQTSPRKTCDLWRDPCFSLPALRQQEHRYLPWSQSWKYKNKWSIQKNLNESHHLTCCLEQAMLRHFS